MVSIACLASAVTEIVAPSERHRRRTKRAKLLRPHGSDDVGIHGNQYRPPKGIYRPTDNLGRVAGAAVKCGPARNRTEDARNVDAVVVQVPVATIAVAVFS